ncbi:hypothetical protein [Paraburkholderia phytofirmans]|uniref:hypothetical protein n=1 Tax=Paraburkholderia phytofirmans TaxID=261302 RepID=UPI0011E03E72|nr:hypothetical protein [Paraburkholderia phytofirmans]
MNLIVCAASGAKEVAWVPEYSVVDHLASGWLVRLSLSGARRALFANLLSDIPPSSDDPSISFPVVRDWVNTRLA